MFILGALVGIFFLAGLVGCAVVQPAWDGVKGATVGIVGSVEDGVSSLYGGAKGAVGAGVGVVENTVADGYNAVAGGVSSVVSTASDAVTETLEGDSE